MHHFAVTFCIRIRAAMYSCLYVFSFLPFSNMSRTILGFGHIRSCREFQALPLDNKQRFNHTNNR